MLIYVARKIYIYLMYFGVVLDISIENLNRYIYIQLDTFWGGFEVFTCQLQKFELTL